MEQELELEELARGARVIGVLGGGGRSGQLVRYYELRDIEQALADSKSGEVIKPILRLP